jgi:Ala-tRNA(Pro) deacylase
MSADILLQIRTLLTDLGIRFREVHHEPTTTSEASARARGEALDIGGKAIFLKTDGVFRLFVLSASRRVDSAAIRQQLHVKKIRFASRDELFKLTGLVPGAVPPFGLPILPLEVFVDPSILTNDTIAFNAGSLEVSIVLKTQDYQRAAAPTIFAFAEASKELSAPLTEV